MSDLEPAARAALALFAKPPRPGLSKTRLAADIGPARSCAFARAFVLDAWRAAHRLDRVVVGLATTEPFADPPLEPPPAWWLQGDGDLGRRMVRVLRRALYAAPIAIALGADVPCLPPNRVERAIELLERDAADVVIGPADDGGFYLMALRECPEDLLDDLPWSTAQTCTATIRRLEDRGLRVATLDAWFDVDRADDLQRLRLELDDSAADSPATAQVCAQLKWPPPDPTVSVIVPVLNESARIDRVLDHLCSFDAFREIVVADGGSADDTRARIQAAQDRQQPGRIRLVDAPRGRARQLNAGAAAARGTIFVFVHADTVLPDSAPRAITELLARKGVVAGAFRTWTIDDDPDAADGCARRILRPLLHLADVRSRYTDLPYGDQAPFMAAETFRRVGGYPDIPLMEDLELSLRLRRLGTIATARESVRVSGRRFLERPIFYTTLVNVYPALYRLGVSPQTLARWYRNVR